MILNKNKKYFDSFSMSVIYISILMLLRNMIKSNIHNSPLSVFPAFAHIIPVRVWQILRLYLKC